MQLDYDDPVIEAQWCAERQADVIAYLKQARIEHGRIGEWPAWHVAPYVSIWAIESATCPDALGGWVISGDLPTDFIDAAADDHPRAAMQRIAWQWRDAARRMALGVPCPAYGAMSAAQAKARAPMLESRAETLMRWARDASLWEDDDDASA